MSSNYRVWRLAAKAHRGVESTPSPRCEVSPHEISGGNPAKGGKRSDKSNAKYRKWLRYYICTAD